jgi:prevent-host-death family protein
MHVLRKNRFSESIRRDQPGEPRTVTVHDKPAAVVLSPEAYAALTKPHPSLAGFLLSSPLIQPVWNRACPMHEWQLQDTKKSFSELVRRAQAEGPQTVTVHGKAAAVVLSPAAYAALTKSLPLLTDYLLSGSAWPDDLVEMINDRARDTGRDPEP